MAETTGVIGRKVAAAKVSLAEGGPGADRGWRLALARAARDGMKLSLEVVTLSLSRMSLGEVLESPPERALVAVLEGPGDGLGVLMMDQPLLAGLIEAQTMGRVSKAETAPRKPTRTDAAMVASYIDAALTGLEDALAEESDLVWAGGFRYASFLDDPRPLGLLLEDCPYRLLRATVSLAGGVKSGEVVMALPADGRGRRPSAKAGAAPEIDHSSAFMVALAERVEGADCRMEAVLARLSLPLAQIMALEVGSVLVLGQAAVDKISLEGLDGRRLADGKLGQNRGMRAIRINDANDQAAKGPVDRMGHLEGGAGGGDAVFAHDRFAADPGGLEMDFRNTASDFLATGTD